MRKKIEQLLNGKFEYEQPALLFSQEKITVTLKAGDTVKGKVYLGTDTNTRIRGYITSSHRRLVPGLDKFASTTVCLPYGIDGAGLKPGDSFTAWLAFTTNVGEYKLPFEVKVEKEQVRYSEGEVKSLEDFCSIARRDFREAYRLFTDKSFAMLLAEDDPKVRALYKGLSQQPVTYQHVEEFLISTGKKEKVEIALKEPETRFYEVRESGQESFFIQRSGWGHLRLDVEVKGDFLEVPKKVVTNEEFIGSYYQVDYILHAEKLGKGNRFGEIIVKSPYQKLTYRILATKGTRVKVNMNAGEKRHKLSLYRDYLEYRLKRMDFGTWAASSHYILNQLGEAGCDYPEYQMWEAYILHLEGNEEGAFSILEKYQNNSFSKDDLEFAGVYLYLCTLCGLYKDKEQALKRVQNFYMQKADSFLLFEILQNIDPVLKESPSRVLFMMEELFEKGCKSPLLYLEAWEYIAGDVSLLHRLNSFWIQVFLFAGKEKLLTQELTMRFAYLSGYEKNFNESMYVALTKGYEAFPDDDTLEAICKYIMKGNPRKPEYFQWFSLAVDRSLRLTRLFEYYVETMDLSYQRELPRPLLMYFTYNSNTLGDARKAFIYASIISHKDQDMATYQTYRPHMVRFAAQKLGEGRINENYAVLYQEFLSHPKDRVEAERLSHRMFTCRLFCDDPKIRQVIVRHNQLAREEIYPCVQGVAYPKLYTGDVQILFQDEKQRRYGATVDFNCKKLLDEREMVAEVLEKGVNEPGVLLNYCESVPLCRDNLEIFQTLVSMDAFDGQYRNQVRKKILDFYAANIRGEELDSYLKKMDYREYAAVDRNTLLRILILRGLYSQALSIIEEVGYEGMDISDILKLTSRMVTRHENREDEELLALASWVYRQGKYDEVILNYLMKYRKGPMDEMLSLWKSARGFEMDTYDLEEKILTLLMFTEDYRKEGEQVLESYVKQSGKERIIGAYLTHISYGIFVKEFPMSSFVRECLENAYMRKWPVNQVCKLAFFMALSKEKNLSQEYISIEKELLAQCVSQGMVFSFFRRLPGAFLSPYQLDDKTFVEYHGNPEAKVTLYYALDTGLGIEPEYISEPMKEVYQGIFSKTFTLFYGETLHYYFQAEKDGEITRSTERAVVMDKVEAMAVSKYQLINQILCARRLGKEQEVLERLRAYLRQEQYVKEMFVLEGQNERNP